MTTTTGLVNTSIISQNCHFFLIFFLRNPTLFSTVTEQIYTPANRHKCLLFSAFANTYLFDKSHSNRDKMISLCSFDLNFLMIHDVKIFFHLSVSHLCVFFGKMSI